MKKDCPNKKADKIGSSVLRESATNSRKPKVAPMNKYRSLAAEEIGEILNVPISNGLVNGEEVLVMRDSGFSFAAVGAKFVLPEQYLDEYEDVLLMDCTPRTFQKARIHVNTKYYSGVLEVFVVENPVVDLVFGNVRSQMPGTCHPPGEALEQGNDNSEVEHESDPETGNKHVPRTTQRIQNEEEQMARNNTEWRESSEEMEEMKEGKCGSVVNTGKKNVRPLSELASAKLQETRELFKDKEVRLSSAVVTRGQEKKELKEKAPLAVPSPELVDRETFQEFQKDDDTLKRYWESLAEEEKQVRGGTVKFEEKNGLLFRVYKPKGRGNQVKQLMVPQKLTRKVLSLAHDGLLSGH